MTSEELKDAAYRVGRCEAGETLLVVYDAESWPLAKIAYRADCERLAIAYLARLAADEQQAESDDATGVPVGWSIVAVGNDGSVLCQSTNGSRRRYWFHDPERIATLEREREQNRKDWAWVCRKIGIPEDSRLLSGDQTVAGQLHVLCANAHGYKTYIAAFRCDDKQGEMARLTVERDEARAAYRNLLESVKQISGCYPQMEKDLYLVSQAYKDKPEWRKDTT